MEIVIYILFYHYFITSSFHPYPSLLYSSTILLSYPYPSPLSYPLIYQPLFYHILFTFTLSPFYYHTIYHSIPSKIRRRYIFFQLFIIIISIYTRKYNSILFYLFSFIYYTYLYSYSYYIHHLLTIPPPPVYRILIYTDIHTHTQTYTHTHIDRHIDRHIHYTYL